MKDQRLQDARGEDRWGEKWSHQVLKTIFPFYTMRGYPFSPFRWEKLLSRTRAYLVMSHFMNKGNEKSVTIQGAIHGYHGRAMLERGPEIPAFTFSRTGEFQ